MGRDGNGRYAAVWALIPCGTNGSAAFAFTYNVPSVRFLDVTWDLGSHAKLGLGVEQAI